VGDQLEDGAAAVITTSCAVTAAPRGRAVQSPSRAEDKVLSVEVKAGLATRKYKLVRSDNPDDLVFQSVQHGKPMRDNNILTRFIKPAGRKLGLGFVNWRCPRTSRATWAIEAGANPKSRASDDAGILASPPPLTSTRNT